MTGAQNKQEDAPSPRIRLKAGARVIIGRLEDPGARLMTFKQRIGPRERSRLEFVSEDGQYLPLSDEQIGYLCQQGEFNLVFSVGGVDRAAPPSPLKLTKKQLAYAERCKAYVDACFALKKDYRRSHPVLKPVLEKVAGARGEKKAAGVTTVLEWIDLWEAGGEQYGISVFIRLRKKGNGHQDLGDAMNSAVKYGVHTALNDGTAADALCHARNWLKINRPGETFEDSAFPSLRTVQRRMAATNKFTADEIKYGTRRARRRNTIHYETKRPLLPLEEVEVDNTPLDMILLDESKTIVLGRPNLISFRDRATGSVLGLVLGWEAPSYAAFMRGFQHAFYPKKPEDTPATRTPWYCWGRMRRLYVDNALEFIGTNIERASQRLLFQLTEFRPGDPYLKGAQERLFKTLNMKVHKLPGATFSNIMERRDRAEIARLPILTRSEVWDYLSVYICDIYHREPHEGLGLLRTQKGVPARLWNAAVDKVSIAPLPPQEDFVALAGDTDFRSINAKGIRWDYIRYGCGELSALRTHPKHRDGRTDGDRPGRKHEGTKYEVKRDPFDLSHIWVINPYDRDARPIKVPAMRLDYANGMTLHQHLVIKNNADKEHLKEPREGEDPEDELLRAKMRLAAAIADLLEIRKEQDIERKLARFLNEEGRKQARSVVTTRPYSPEASRSPLEPGRKRTATGSGGRKSPLLDANGTSPGPESDGIAPSGAPKSTRPAKQRPSSIGRSIPLDLDEDDDFDVEALQRQKAEDKKWNAA